MIALLPVFLFLATSFLSVGLSLWQTRKKLEETSVPLKDPDLERAFARLARALDINRVPVWIHENETYNAFATFDNKVYVTSAFVNAWRQGKVHADELTSVIAHELGHVACGHSKKRLAQFVLQSGVRAALMGSINRVLPGVGHFLANIVQNLLAKSLSRKDEFEADRFASALLIKAGLGVEPQVRMFESLERLNGRRGHQGPVWFASHPPTSERIAAIRRNEASWLGG